MVVKNLINIVGISMEETLFLRVSSNFIKYQL